MPWYKLPHSSLVMWFDQKMPDLKSARKPRAKRAKKPAAKAKAVKPADRAVAAAEPHLGAPYIWDGKSPSTVPNAPKPKEEAGAE